MWVEHVLQYSPSVYAMIISMEKTVASTKLPTDISMVQLTTNILSHSSTEGSEWKYFQGAVSDPAWNSTIFDGKFLHFEI